MGVLTACKPRKEVLKGDLEDAVFAADFGDLISGKAPKVYGDAKTFFQNTHPARQLRKVVEVVFARLASPKEAGATIRLSTGFGGGKTHTLMALWHLAGNIDDLSLGAELLPAAGRPKEVEVVAVDAAKAGVPEFARHGALKVHSLWGEVFFWLSGAKAVKALGKADDPEASPSEAQIRAAFPKGPVLILLDELVIYMAKLAERGQGNVLGFVNSLASVVTKRPQTVMIVTDPAGQVAYATQAAQLARGLEAVASKLDEVLGRKMTDFDPIGDESARVIGRRLFSKIDATAAQAASATYHALYQRVVSESPGAVAAQVADAGYAKDIVECYPFHPRLLATARDRLGALQDFQKSRGVLRLFARILRDVWEAKQDHELITAGEIDWSSPRIQADLLQRLNRDRFKPAVSADVEGHAGALDGGAHRGIHRRVASALLMESLPLQSNSGLDPADLTLAVLRPDEAGPEPAEALDRLVGSCWHTYPMAGGRGWQFRYEPNVIKQVEERMSNISLEDARSRVLAEAQAYFSGPSFKLTPWPSSARQVPELADLQLVLCEDEALAKAVCAHGDDTDQKAPVPRRFQNAILAVTATASSLNSAVERAQRLLAAEEIEREYRTGETGKLVREQLQKLKPELNRQFRIETCRAFNRLVLAGGMAYTLEEKFQVSEQQMLQRDHGQACLHKFLNEKGLIYQPGDALDADRFLAEVLQGATPQPDKPQVYTAKAVHERFLAAPGLRLLPDGSIVRQTVLKAVAAGKVLVRLADGHVYDASGCVEGRQGRRRRISGILTTFALDDEVQITPSDSAEGKAWVKVDTDGPAPGPGGGGMIVGPPPTAARVTVTDWDQTVGLAAERPLTELQLTAHTPAAAAALLGLAQPLGADKLSLSVAASGSLKDGGMMNFSANNVKPGHPAKPLAIAQTVFNSLTAGSTYEAVPQARLWSRWPHRHAGRASAGSRLGSRRTRCQRHL